MQKYSILSGMPLDLIQKVIRFKPIVMGAPINLKGAIFKFFQTFSHVPSLGFEVYYENKGIYFAGDTLYDPDLLTTLSHKGVMTKDRAHALSTIKWGFFNLIILYVGPYAWNTDVAKLRKLPESYR